MTATLKCFAVMIHFEGAVAQTMILAPDSGLAIAMGTAAAFKSEGAVGDIVGVNAHEVDLAWLKRAVAVMEGEKPPGEVVPLSLVPAGPQPPLSDYVENMRRQAQNEKHRPTPPPYGEETMALQNNPYHNNAGSQSQHIWPDLSKPPDGSAA